MSLEEEKNRLLDLFEEVLSGAAANGGKKEKESLPYHRIHRQLLDRNCWTVIASSVIVIKTAP